VQPQTLCEKEAAGELVTFVIDRTKLYQYLHLKCKFCAFTREPDAKDAYVRTSEEILEKMMKLSGWARPRYSSRAD